MSLYVREALWNPPAACGPLHSPLVAATRCGAGHAAAAAGECRDPESGAEINRYGLIDLLTKIIYIYTHLQYIYNTFTFA